MFTVLKSIFQPKCPVCSGKLQTTKEADCYAKVCPHGHYKEESYSSLGITVVYDGAQS